MITVYFTRNLTTDNRNNGLKYLKIFFNNSKLAMPPYYPVTNFDGLVKFLDGKYPTYIESLGETGFEIGEDRMKQSMLDVARLAETTYPIPARFATAIMNNTKGISLTRVVSTALTESAKEVVSFTQSSFKYLTWIVAAAVGLAIFTKLGGKIQTRSNPTKRGKK